MHVDFRLLFFILHFLPYHSSLVVECFISILCLRRLWWCLFVYQSAIAQSTFQMSVPLPHPPIHTRSHTPLFPPSIAPKPNVCLYLHCSVLYKQICVPPIEILFPVLVNIWDWFGLRYRIVVSSFIRLTCVGLSVCVRLLAIQLWSCNDSRWGLTIVIRNKYNKGNGN